MFETGCYCGNIKEGPARHEVTPNISSTVPTHSGYTSNYLFFVCFVFECTCVCCVCVCMYGGTPVCAGVHMHVCPDLRLMLSVFLNFSLLHLLGLVLFWTQNTAFSSLSIQPALSLASVLGLWAGNHFHLVFYVGVASRLQSLCRCGKDFTC